MPFTPAHAAAALPFRRLQALPLDALVVGTMVPDLPLFLRYVPNYTITHSLIGCVPVGVPLGIVLLLLARFARPSTVWLLPEAMRSRIDAQTPAASLEAGWDVVSLALAIGIATHVLWDSFTHEDRWGVNLVGALSQIWVRNTPVGPLPGFKIMQYGTSLLGLCVVALAAQRALAQRAPQPVTRSLRDTRVRALVWTLVLVIGPALSFARAYRRALRVADGFNHVLTHVFASTALLFAAAVLLVFAAGRALQPSGLRVGRSD